MRGGRSLVLLATGVGAVAGMVTPVRADSPWSLSFEAPGAVPLTSPQRLHFGIGGMPAAAAYRSLAPWALVGVRLRTGMLRDGDPPGDGNLADPGAGGLGSVTAGLRVGPLGEHGAGPWVELAAGGGLTGHRARPVFEAGLGWGVALGSVNLGPSLRYLHIYQIADPLAPRAAGLALLGIEVSLFATPPRSEPMQRAVAPPPRVARDQPRSSEILDRDQDGIRDDRDQCPEEAEDFDQFEDEDGCPDLDRDGDGIADASDQCPEEAEVVNGVEDADGCPDEGLFIMIEDRIVLEERILFDKNRARVKRNARPVLRAIVALWKQHPEWDRMIVEGHADNRGPDKYNDWLSDQRAQRVRDALLELGMRREKVAAQGMGSTKPRHHGKSEEAHQRNRRVEFVVIDARDPRRDRAKKSAPAGRVHPPAPAVGDSAAPGADDSAGGDAPSGTAAAAEAKEAGPR